MNTIVVLGASGYIGRNLVAELANARNVRVKVLSRSRQRDIEENTFPVGVEIVQGDLCDPGSLSMLFEPECVVINLAYLWDAGEQKNLEVIQNLMTACEIAQVKRLVHLSTAMVTGRTRSNHISETDSCHPRTEYAISKLKIEQCIANAAGKGFDTVILRPTAVFGPGGQNLKKLARDLVAGKRVRNYLKSCLFGRRRMNLVHIANVLAAIVFLSTSEKKFNGDVFIISDAENVMNNFQDVERVLMLEFGIPAYKSPHLWGATFLLELILMCLGKDNTNPRCDYFSGKLENLGFVKPVGFKVGLADYAAWYHSVPQSH